MRKRAEHHARVVPFAVGTVALDTACSAPARRDGGRRRRPWGDEAENEVRSDVPGEARNEVGTAPGMTSGRPEPLTGR